MKKDTYKVQVWRRGDDHPAYTILVKASYPEIAVIEAFEFLVKNAWWPMCMTDQEKREHLMLHKVEKLESGEFPYEARQPMHRRIVKVRRKI